MLVRAKEKMYYSGRDRLPGEVYDMDPREAVEINVLCLLEKIELVHEEQTVSAAPKYPKASIEPESQPGNKEAEEKDDGQEGSEEEPHPHRRRTYRRRDMRPEK